MPSPPAKNVVYMGGGKSDEEYMEELADLKLQLVAAENFPVEFEGCLNLMIKPSDLGYGNWKKVVAHLG